MSTTTMHFGPEWMRTKQHPTTKAHNPPSPPSTYSSLVSSLSPVLFEKRDDPNPFRYSKEEILGIYTEGNVKTELGLEVERWDGVVREAPSDPVGLREMDEAEKKLFSGSLNSDLRRRQSGDYLSPLSTSMDRSRLSYSNSNANSPLRERFGALRRRDSTADSPTGTSSLPRKQSVSSFQNPGISSRDVSQPSSRSRVGLASNFDGVLNNSGETWVARRRASEASLKGAIAMSREVSGDFHNEARANEIQEETEEQDDGMVKSLDRMLRGQRAQADSGTIQDPGLAEPEADIQVDHSSKITIDYGKSNLGGAANGPPGLQDFASVEWSYKDPTGQIQGPFRADLMQKWYDEGYFSLNLPTKRTHLDSQWTTVNDLVRGAGGDKVFLSHRPMALPGLVRRNDSTSQPCGASAEHYIYPGLNQPSPIRTLRSSTLDNYVASVSNSSDSPLSFSGPQRSTGSPESCDPSAKTSNPSYFGDQSMNGRTANLVSMAETSAPFPARRATYGDALDPYPGVAPSRTASLGDYAPNGIYNSGSHAQAFDPMSSRTVEPVPLSAYSQSPIIEQGLSYHSIRNGHDGVFPDSVFGSTAPSQLEFGSASRGQRPGGVNADTSAYNKYNHFSAAINNPRSTQSHFGQTGPAFLSHPNAQPPINTPIDSLNPSPSLQTVCTVPETLGRSPWQETANVPASQRSEALDGSFRTETSATTISTTTPQVAPWSNKLDALHAQEISPWSYGETVADLKSELQHDQLTFSNVVQHNQQYQSVDAQDPALGSSNQQVDHLSLAPTSPSPFETTTVPSDLIQPSEVTMQPNQSRKPTTPVATVVPDTSDTSEKVNAPQTLHSKTAWAKDDDFKKLPSTISLREIQEAEAKKSEARKATERPMKAVPSEPKDDVQPFTTSWGLPTSQVGTRLPAPQKEGPAAPSPSTSAPPQPVWTNATRTVATKKSMKEIQEEEERRKISTVTKETTVATTVATTGRKPSAEPVNKNPVNQASAWTVVGAGGRHATAGPAGPASLKLPSASTSSAVQTSSAPRVDGPATAKQPASSVPAKPVTSKIVDDFPPSPSHDFLRWLTESLKGLNNSVNVEEILSMLLSFPLDPDPSTVELISDLIYTNSTTLDGRRFATEYVSKRKNDAASKAKTPGTSGKSVSKPVSIADVVKAAPKSAQSEWAFKIVNKKKKGGKGT